ncbi:hypothetical protein KFE25_009464 [Diacronema lutheri]|uniref:Phosphoglycerate mutase n=1 Tax=Diacronema lutheri TaxID=2081491 RepID=A0A8J5XST8_DIALT|nr:hypothetical protein KFE25_009464 [Diacronema lutheri]
MAGGQRRVLLLLLRHAQSENNHAGADDSASPADVGATRLADPPLSERGFAQSEACASWINSEFGARIVHIHCSPMIRTLQTVVPLAQVLSDVPISLHTDAFEVGGCFNGPRADDGRGHPLHYGLGPAEIRKLIPAMRVSAEDFASSPGWWRGGFESDVESRARAARVCEWAWSQVPLEPRDPAAELPVGVLVTHGFFISYLLQAMLGVGAGGSGPSVALLSANGAIWLLELRITCVAGQAEARSFAVLAAGRTDHVPPPLRSGQKLNGFEIPRCME